jgi:hypothetical protein
MRCFRPLGAGETKAHQQRDHLRRPEVARLQADAQGRCTGSARSRHGQDPRARPERSTCRSGHNLGLLAPHASTSFDGRAGERCRSRARGLTLQRGRSATSRANSRSASAARTRAPDAAKIERVLTCALELRIGERPRLVQGPAVAVVGLVEAAHGHKLLENQGFTRHVDQSGSESTDLPR